MAQETVNRRLAAILAADMVGFSRHMQRDEAGTVARQSACLKELVNPAIKEFGGRLVKTTGDGYLVEFHSAVDAVSCAVNVQREMAAREQDVPLNCCGVIQRWTVLFGIYALNRKMLSPFR